MQAAGVQSVVSMLSPSELETYAEPLPAAMQAAFGAGNYANIDAKAPGETRSSATTAASSAPPGLCRQLSTACAGRRSLPCCRARLTSGQTLRVAGVTLPGAWPALTGGPPRTAD